MTLDIGVLSIQGDVDENIISTRAAINQLGINGNVLAIKTPERISDLDGLVIPGGESTTIGQMSLVNGSIKVLKERIQDKMPVLGICAGMIMLSRSADDRAVGRTDQPLLGALDVHINRNSFGRQRESFEAEISMEPLEIPRFRGVFIRAPSLSDVGSGVQVVSRLGDKITAVKKDNIIGTAFHPELTKDVSLHKYFVNMARSAN